MNPSLLVLSLLACRVDVSILGLDDSAEVDETGSAPDVSVDSEEADADADGFLASEDCDDADPDAWPGAPERCDDGVDQDCWPDTECAGLCVAEVQFPGPCSSRAAWSGPRPALLWRFEGGAEPVDTSGSGRDGLAVGSWARTLAVAGTGAVLDGFSHAQVDAGQPTSWTWAQWVRLESLPSQDFAMLANLGNGTVAWTGWAVTVNRQGHPGAYIEGGNGSLERILTGPAPLCVGGWAHIAVTFSGGALSLFVNGEPVAALTAPYATIPYGGLPLIVGYDGNQRRRHLRGAIDEAALWHEALGADQVRALWEGGLCGAGI